MMRGFIWLSLLVVVVVYVLIVNIIDFEGYPALIVHFTRIALTVATLVLYIQEIPDLFSEVPPPRWNYLMAAITFFMLSAVCFSLLNEANRIFGIDNNVFTGSIAGLFSLFLIVGSGLALIAPYSVGSGRKTRAVAIVIGVIIAVGLVLIAPLYRQ